MEHLAADLARPDFSWSAYHVQQQSVSLGSCVWVLLPLFREHGQNVSMHAIIQASVEKLNPYPSQIGLPVYSF